MAKTGQYRWPGNLRELENIVRRYLALSPYLSRSIKLSDIFEPSELAEGPRESGGWENSGELQKILSTYYRMGCSKTLTAQELGISRSTLWRKLRQIRNPGQLIRLGARTATTAIGLARARGTARLEIRVCDMICPASYGSHRRSGNAGKSPRLKRKGVGSERKGTPDEAGSLRRTRQLEREKAGAL